MKNNRGGDEEDDECNIQNKILPSLPTSCACANTKEKNIAAIVLSLNATKDAKINVLAEESSAGMLTLMIPMC